jgi:anti-anti-sigma factor
MRPMDSRTGDEALGTAETSTGTVDFEQQDEAVVVRVTGALDLALAPKVQQLVDRAARLRPDLLVLDLSGVDFLASAGMAVLVKASRDQVAPTKLRVVAAERVVLRPLEITRLTDELAVYPTLSSAFAG